VSVVPDAIPTAIAVALAPLTHRLTHAASLSGPAVPVPATATPIPAPLPWRRTIRRCTSSVTRNTNKVWWVVHLVSTCSSALFLCSGTVDQQSIRLRLGPSLGLSVGALSHRHCYQHHAQASRGYNDPDQLQVGQPLRRHVWTSTSSRPYSRHLSTPSHVGVFEGAGIHLRQVVRVPPGARWLFFTKVTCLFGSSEHPLCCASRQCVFLKAVIVHARTRCHVCLHGASSNYGGTACRPRALTQGCLSL